MIRVLRQKQVIQPQISHNDKVENALAKCYKNQVSSPQKINPLTRVLFFQRFRRSAEMLSTKLPQFIAFEDMKNYRQCLELTFRTITNFETEAYLKRVNKCGLKNFATTVLYKKLDPQQIEEAGVDGSAVGQFEDDPLFQTFLQASLVMISTVIGWEPTAKKFVICHLQPKECRSCGSVIGESGVDFHPRVCISKQCAFSKIRQSQSIRLTSDFHAKFSQYKISTETFNQKMPINPDLNNLEEVITNQYQYAPNFRWTGKLMGAQFVVPNMMAVEEKDATAIIHARDHQFDLALRAKTSSIKGAGTGIFATANILEGTVIATYSGDMYSSSEFPYEERNNSIVDWGWVGNELIMIHPKFYANVGRFFNGQIGKNSVLKANMLPRWILVKTAPEKCDCSECAQPVTLFLILIAKRAIRIGQQLIWNYGPGYKLE